MANIWRKDDNVKEQPKRNIMDLSFQNNLTTQFGKLVPVFCKEFIPGDSFSIKPTFSLKFQPMVFPIQTRMRAHLHFFKVRNRNLWKDWEDFIAKNKENLDPPYLDTAVTEAKTGSLLDYLGVPTTRTGSYAPIFENVGTVVGSEGRIPFILKSVNGVTYTQGDEMLSLVEATYSYISAYNPVGKVLDLSSDNLSTEDSEDAQAFVYELDGVLESLSSLPSELRQMRFTLSRLNNEETSGTTLNAFLNRSFDNLIPQNLTDLTVYPELSAVKGPHTTYALYNVVGLDDDNVMKFVKPASYYDQSTGLHVDLSDVSFEGVTKLCMLIFSRNAVVWIGTGYDETRVARVKAIDFDDYVLVGALRGWSNRLAFSPINISVPSSVSAASFDSDEVQDIDKDSSPYWRSDVATDLRERIKLSALPCRAYEQIYNSFYRNAENNPYILNGVPEYNKYMPTDEGGVDANLYDFYYRNWEDDFLTTALQQPQAGIAPLVGLTGTAGTATVTLADEDGNVSEATASYDEEGNVTSVAFANNTSLTEALADAVTYGISINDLRNVNAFQRWLEAKARGGYKYRDVIETMFGISVRYDTLDMPEFIGGTSIDIMVNQISQTTPTETSPLGDYAGQAAGIGTGQTINEYFDEHGFIIGILSVVPVPNYSQLLPKHFIKRDAFDYYFPQFGHIGMQPIKYDEVCPVQAFQDSTEQNNVLDETFGYQRAWYDYLASTDEVHGEFRTNLRNFVMNRTFDVKPELVNEFLTVDPSQLNDVFAIQDDSYDKILGQIYFDVKAKRPIPLYGIPKLE